MSRLREEVQGALRRLSERHGFQRRPGQEQAALIIADAIEGAARAMIEAPTGSGKSLAALIPALAHAKSGGRVVIATFTNILAEQYWRKDLPIAMSLFDWPEDEPPKATYLVGRTRYACRLELERRAGTAIAERFLDKAENGTDSEFFSIAQRWQDRRLWREIAVPPACQGRKCTHYRDCFFYRARSAARSAKIVITNHSVFLSDLLVRQSTQGRQDLLGPYDFAILDEGHDFPQAAASAMSYSLNQEVLRQSLEVVQRALDDPSLQRGALKGLIPLAHKRFRAGVRAAEEAYQRLGQVAEPGIVAVSPEELLFDPRVGRSQLQSHPSALTELLDTVIAAYEGFFEALQKLKSARGARSAEEGDDEVFDMLLMYVAEILYQCQRMKEPDPVSLTYLDVEPRLSVNREVIDVGERLRALLEGGPPCAVLSATLTVDGSFQFLSQESGIRAQFEEALPPVFDFERHAALYVPSLDAIPDPSTSRDEDSAPLYYEAVAEQVQRILQTVGGRSLVLFHSRKEMEAVYRIVEERTSLPILMQQSSDAREVGERFRRDIHASLFAVRSFWTGFDAPGETLSCVVLVRIPFEVPVDPGQVVRHAWLRSQGRDPFWEYTLPLAKMMVRQGAGRLLRTESDRGVICLLDPRVRTRSYGRQLIENLPPMPVFERIEDAVAFVGVGTAGSRD